MTVPSNHHLKAAHEELADLVTPMHESWITDGQACADRWFGGDFKKAANMLDLLPHSRTPAWSDIDALMGQALAGQFQEVRERIDVLDATQESWQGDSLGYHNLAQAAIEDIRDLVGGEREWEDMQ